MHVVEVSLSIGMGEVIMMLLWQFEALKHKAS